MNLRVFRSADDLREGLRDSCHRAASTALVPSMLFSGKGVRDTAVSLLQGRTRVLVTIAEESSSADVEGRAWASEVTWISPGETPPPILIHAPFDLAVVNLNDVRRSTDFFATVARNCRRFIVVSDGTESGDSLTDSDLERLEPMDGVVWTFVVEGAVEP